MKYKLNELQKKALLSVCEDELYIGDGSFPNKTMYALYTRRLISCFSYKNGNAWNITKEGLEYINYENK